MMSICLVADLGQAAGVFSKERPQQPQLSSGSQMLWASSGPTGHP